jgi:hypothetical protein
VTTRSRAGIAAQRAFESVVFPACVLPDTSRFSPVIALIEPDQQLAVGGNRVSAEQLPHDVFEFAGRDLAGAATAVRGLRQPNRAGEHRHRADATRATRITEPVGITEYEGPLSQPRRWRSVRRCRALS